MTNINQANLPTPSSQSQSTSTKTSSYYYMSSYSMTTYNENGNVKTKKSIKIKLDDNGKKDHYQKKSIITDNEEKILLENGNADLINASKFGMILNKSNKQLN